MKQDIYNKIKESIYLSRRNKKYNNQKWVLGILAIKITFTLFLFLHLKADIAFDKSLAFITPLLLLWFVAFRFLLPRIFPIGNIAPVTDEEVKAVIEKLLVAKKKELADVLILTEAIKSDIKELTQCL